jgi:hypothetical protein
MRILEWLAQDRGVGLSSKAIALTALGEMPKRPNYPHDGDDFGRCYKLLALCPDAKLGLERLGKEGGAVWQALVPRWHEIEVAYLHDMDLYERGERDFNKYKCYSLMQSIIRPIEDAEGSVIRGKNFTVRTA